MGAKRNARIELTADAGKMAPGLNDAKRQLRAFERDQKRAAKEAERDAARAAKRHKENAVGFGNSAAGLGHGIVMGAAAAAGFDLVGVLGRSTKGVFEFEKELTRFQIDAQLSGQKAAEFREQIMRASKESGVSRQSILEAAHAYQILTGDADGAVKASALFAEVANASGATMEDIAASAASMKQNMGFDPSEFRKGFDVLLSMGHMGSVELRDFASELAGLAPQMKMFGQASGMEKWTEMAAAMQVVRKNFGSAAETATGFRALMTSISKDGVDKKLEKFGVKAWEIDPKTKKNVRRDLMDIVGDIVKNPALDDKALSKVFSGRQEAARALGAMKEHWQEIEELKRQANNSDQTAKDNATYMASTTGRMAKAWNDVEIAIAKALTPERIEAFAGAAQKALAFIADSIAAIDHFVNGPGKEEGANTYAQDLLDEATRAPKTGVWERGLVGDDEKPEEIEQIAIDAAKNAARGTNDMANAKYGKEGAKAGAIKFLKSEGQDVSSWGDLYRNQANPQTQALAAAGIAANPDVLAKAVADAVANAMSKVQLVVKASDSVLATTVVNAPNQRAEKVR